MGVAHMSCEEREPMVIVNLASGEEPKFVERFKVRCATSEKSLCDVGNEFMVPAYTTFNLDDHEDRDT